MTLDPVALADIHSHLVPGVDDGARTLEDTLGAVERMVQEGIRKILTTPHLDGSLTLEPARIEGRLAQVSAAFDVAAQAVRAHFPEVEFLRGHEVMLDVPNVDVSDSRVRLGGSSFVLIEWPRLHVPPRTAPVLQRIHDEGYHPIVAHPERYIDFDLEVAYSWREAGALLQVNYGSLAGRYGGGARDMALTLLRRGWVDYLASDYHGRPEKPIYRREAWERLSELGADEALACLCITNPSRIFRNEPPLQVPLIADGRGFWARVKGILNVEPA